MFSKHRIAFSALAFALIGAGCTHSPSAGLVAQFRANNSPSHFLVCRDYGCAVRMWVTLNDAEWANVRAVFSTPAPDAAAEREQMREAVALLERMVGPKAGTSNDEAGAAILNFQKQGQLDCIDEAYNTTNYLRFMAADGLFRWHDVGTPARRGYILNRWPHNTATVIEHGTNQAYVVDSWFGANGQLPDVVTLELWEDGWSPDSA
jgi:hypothetical protein